MPPAFATFDEPHAWLIRGLVEYGWPDVTRMSGHVPPGVFGGLDLSVLPDADGRDGVFLNIPAVSQGQECIEDGIYRFQVMVAQGSTGVLAYVIRCPEANYFQEFAIDPSNPTHAAGYIHQSLQEYVSQFVQWRLAGNDLSWSQRSGIPTVAGDPCSSQLSAFVRQRTQANHRFDRGPAEGWWVGTGPATISAQDWQGPIATVGKGGGDVQFLSGATTGASGSDVQMVASVQASRRTKGPGALLLVMSCLGMLQGVLWFANGVWVVLNDSAEVIAIAVSVLGTGILVMGGLVSLLGALKYKKAQSSFLVYFTFLYCALTPLCCLFGLPGTIWAVMTWRDPMVKAART